jgi:hypothetical protein
MSRIRTIKPEFFTSADIVKLTPLARLFYVSLWCEADREGYLKWDTDTLKMRYLGGDQVDIETLAGELFSRGLVVLYVDEDGTEYAEIPSFKQHQVINNREAPSVLASRVKEACTRVLAEGKEGREGKEGKGRELVRPKSPDAPPEEIAAKPTRRRGNDDDYKTARWMYGLVLTVNATAKQPNFDVWADEVRLIREIDARTHSEICELFQWAKRDSFWCANIQSPSKLRDKWDQLTEQRARPAKQAAASWWSSDAASIAKGAELSLVPLAGETIMTFRARIQAAIDNGGKPPAPTGARITPPKPIEPKGVKPDGLNLKGMIGRDPRESA